MKIPKLLHEFISYNVNQFEKVNTQTDKEHHQNPIWMTADVLNSKDVSPVGWIAGNFKLPENIEIPKMDMDSYIFICAIDCSQLPSNAWGGIGPRKGKLAIFLEKEGDLNVKAIHYESENWQKPKPTKPIEAYSTFRFEMADYPDFVPDLPSWPLQILDNCSTVDEAYTTSEPWGQNVFPKYRTQDLEFAPNNLWELRLLVKLVHTNLTKSNEQAYQALERKKIALSLDSSKSISLLEKRVYLLQQALEQIKSKYTSNVFSEENWIEEYHLLAPIYAVDIVQLLESREPLIKILVANRDLANFTILPGYPDELKNNWQQFNVTFQELRAKLDELCTQIPLFANGELNRHGYARFRDSQPNLWESYAEQLRDIKQQFVELCFKSFRYIRQHEEKGNALPSDLSSVIFYVGMGKPVQSMQDLNEKLMDIIQRTQVQIKFLSDTEAHEKELVELELKYTSSSNILSKISQFQTDINLIQDHQFERDDWLPFLIWIDELLENKDIYDGWQHNYTKLRTLFSQNLYQKEPNQISIETRMLLEKQWGDQARLAPIQIGGEPLGWCHQFIDELPETLVLLQIPTNYLTSFMFGDVKHLVISIKRKHFKAGKFDKIIAEISN